MQGRLRLVKKKRVSMNFLNLFNQFCKGVDWATTLGDLFKYCSGLSTRTVPFELAVIVLLGAVGKDCELLSL